MPLIIEYLGYQIKTNKATPYCWTVATVGKGGKIPDVLSGAYTSPAIAKREIDRYLTNKITKEKPDANKESGQSGS